MTSNREKKRIVDAGLRNLLSKPGWDPRKFRSGMTGIDADSTAMSSLQTERTGSTYTKAEGCPECAKARKTSGDDTALCERHMREAMGLG